MKAEPLSKKLHAELLALKVETFTLHWSGGDDQGYLDIAVTPDDVVNAELYEKIDNWAWDAYSYNGAGDGSAYGDNITYDLVNGVVTTSEWFTTRQESEEETEKIAVEETEEEAEE